MKQIRFCCAVLIGCCCCFFLVFAHAQESDPQKLLLESVKYDKLDISGVREALAKGANPNWVSGGKLRENVRSVIGQLAFAAFGANEEGTEEKSAEILQILFKAGAKLQPCDREVLLFPVVEGWVIFTEILLQNGASPTHEVEGYTPMEMAARYNLAEMTELLKKYGAPALESRTAAQLRLIQAASLSDISGMDEAVRNGALVSEANRRGQTALTEALSYPLITLETYGTIQYLLEKGADPTIQGQGGFGKTSALHCIIKGSSLIFDAEAKKQLSKRVKDSPLYARLIIGSLLRHGALVSARDNDGMTPLHIAAQTNNIVGAKMLLQAGAKVMPKDNRGRTPLDYAESAEMIKLLKDYGAREE